MNHLGARADGCNVRLTGGKKRVLLTVKRHDGG